MNTIPIPKDSLSLINQKTICLVSNNGLSWLVNEETLKKFYNILPYDIKNNINYDELKRLVSDNLTALYSFEVINPFVYHLN
jgi:flagellin-specific chaperone FliS